MGIGAQPESPEMIVKIRMPPKTINLFFELDDALFTFPPFGSLLFIDPFYMMIISNENIIIFVKLPLSKGMKKKPSFRSIWLIPLLL